MEAYAALRHFLQLSHTLHFAKAARLCHTSPSTLTRTIQRLEDELGLALFERGRAGVRLTPDGQRFQRHASEVLQRWDGFVREGHEDRAGLRGTLRLFCSVTASHSIVPGLLARFRRAHPGVKLVLETGVAADALDMLARDAVDVSIAAVPPRLRRELVAKVVAHTPLSFVGPTADCPVSRAIDATPIDWSAAPLVVTETGLLRQMVDRWFKRRRIKPRIYAEVPGHDAILALVSLGCGIGVLPGLVVERSPLRRDVRILDLQPAVGDFRVAACTKRKNLATRTVAALWETLDER